MSNYQNLETEKISRELRSEVTKHFIFRGLSNVEMGEILPAFRPVTLKEGEYLLQEGMETSSTLYLVIRGSLEATKEAPLNPGEVHVENHPKFKIATLNPGDVIGELSFIERGPRSASIRSVGKSFLLSLDRADLVDLEPDRPRASSQIMRNLLTYVAEK